MIDVTYPQMPIIETEKYILRPASLDDAEDMFEYYKQPKVVKYLPMNPHKSVANTKRFIKSFFIDNYNQGKIGHFVVVDKLNNKVIGNIGLNNIDKDAIEAEIGICINPSYWGNDIATELARELLKFAFINTNIKRIIANTYEDNKHSRRALENLNIKYYKTYDKKIEKGIKTTYVKCDSYKILKSEYLKYIQEEQDKTNSNKINSSKNKKQKKRKK